MVPFCHFCNCDVRCIIEHNLLHAKTISGEWVCNYCYDFEFCPDDGTGFGCGDLNCGHRPKLQSGFWFKYEISKTILVA